ncbi:response regulator [bacterium]|nr:response regulator [bacterium]
MGKLDAFRPILPSISVLVVDDQDYIVDLLADIVESLGFKTSKAHDGVEALDIFDAGDFKLVITDIKMPRMDGIELMSRIRDRRSDVGVIAITGYGELETEELLLNEGMDSYLTKPFHVESIEDAICRVLKKYNQLHP